MRSPRQNQGGVMTKWFDSRVKKPNCKMACIYPVIFYCHGVSVLNGYATWMPKDQYTDGDWVNVMGTNSGKHSNSLVLYWKDIPERPEGIEL